MVTERHSGLADIETDRGELADYLNCSGTSPVIRLALSNTPLVRQLVRMTSSSGNWKARDVTRTEEL